MAATTEPTATRRAASNVDAKVREEMLEDQIAQLQADLKAIASSLAKLSGDKVTEVRGMANDEVRHLKKQGQHVVEDVQDQATAMEKHLKDTIREKPLTSVASAIGIGFVLALLSRH